MYNKRIQINVKQQSQHYDDKLCALVLPTPNNTNITCAHCKYYIYVGGKQAIFYEILQRFATAINSKSYKTILELTVMHCNF